jgi:AcrR family transcriptional regulator
MSKDTKELIQNQAKEIFALYGYDGLSMRKLAQESGIAASVIYHHYINKDQLLKETFDVTNIKLGQKRRLLPESSTAVEMLEGRIRFQLDNAADVVFVLKYYMQYRDTFEHIETGFVPKKAYLHIEEVLIKGLETGEFELAETVDKEAKIITHMINGFVLEYYPSKIPESEKLELIESVKGFILRALQRRQPMR